MAAKHILNCAEKLADFLRSTAAEEHETSRARIGRLWPGLAALLQVATAYSPSDEQIRNYQSQAYNWALDYVAAFGAEDLTSYLHILAFHVHQYLHEYRSLGKFANWASEGLHSEVKYDVLHLSPRAGGKGNNAPAMYALLQHILKEDLRARGMLQEPRTREWE